MDIAHTVADAAVRCVPRLRAGTTFFKSSGNAFETSTQSNKTRPDASFASITPDSREAENPHWVDIAATGAYNKSGTSKRQLTNVS